MNLGGILSNAALGNIFGHIGAKMANRRGKMATKRPKRANLRGFEGSVGALDGRGSPDCDRGR